MEQAKTTRRRTWIDELRPNLRERVNAELDCGFAAAAVYRRWNLVRFTLSRNFRLYAEARRRRIKQRGNRRPFRAEPDGAQRVEAGASCESLPWPPTAREPDRLTGAAGSDTGADLAARGTGERPGPAANPARKKRRS